MPSLLRSAFLTLGGTGWVQPSTGHAREPGQALVVGRMRRLAMLPSSQSSGCSRGASGLAEQSSRCVQLGKRACPGQARSGTELYAAPAWRAQFLLLETPGWKEGGGLCRQRGTRAPSAPFFPAESPSRSSLPCSPKGTNPAGATGACARALGRGLALTSHGGTAREGGRAVRGAPRFCVRVCARVCLHVCVRARARVHMCVRACVSVQRAGGRVCARAGATGCALRVLWV